MDILKGFMDRGLEEVDYKEFYRDIFPVGELERKGIYETGKYNGIIVEVTDEKKSNGKPKILRHTLTDDLDKLDEVVSRDNFCLMSPVSYIGKSRENKHARLLYALAIDLDGIDTEERLDFLFRQIENGDTWRAFVWGIPTPTYLVSSGTGVHLYYVFEKPIPMFNNIVDELRKLKRRLTWQAWTQGASVLSDNVQYESLFQGFRVVGTITKKGTRTKAFRYGEKVTVEYLNEFVPEEYRTENFTYKSNLTLAQAKEKYPEWYEKRIVQKQPKGTWKCKRDLYDWWIKKVIGGANQGHRYWCVMTLATYAKKCDISREELERDAIDLMDILNKRGTEPFTIEDVFNALEAYNDSYMTYPIDTIVARTDIPIQKNKRNGRKQGIHLKLARGQKAILKDLGEMKSEGRPKGSGTKENLIHEFLEEHSEENLSVTEIARRLNISRPTVYKYLKK